MFSYCVDCIIFTSIYISSFFTDGQGVVIRLSKQVNACNRKLKKIVTEYNNLQWPPQTGIFPSHLEFWELCDASSQLYTLFDEEVSRIDLKVLFNFLHAVIHFMLLLHLTRFHLQLFSYFKDWRSWCCSKEPKKSSNRSPAFED